jgi:hypothetical protein
MPNSFAQYIGIDYSGAGSAEDSHKGISVWAATRSSPPTEIRPNEPKGSYWSRRTLAAWLTNQLRESQVPILVGIDHGFSFPIEYFQRYGLTTWRAFLEDFRKHWPLHEPQRFVDEFRPEFGGKLTRGGAPTTLRLCEQWTSSAKSVFAFDGPGRVGKATHTGLPWLLQLKEDLGDKVHVWPFEGWKPREGAHVLSEVYPSLYHNRYPSPGLTGDQRDARAVALWMQDMATRGELEAYFSPPLNAAERKQADLEGWILGVR